MIVAQSLLDNAGRTILQEGGRLTPMIIGRLEKWGITAVTIRGDDTAEMPKAAASPGATLLENATADDREFMRGVAMGVQERFQNVDGNPVMDDLKRIALQQIVLKGRGVIPGLK